MITENQTTDDGWRSTVTNICGRMSDLRWMRISGTCQSEVWGRVRARVNEWILAPPSPTSWCPHHASTPTCWNASSAIPNGCGSISPLATSTKSPTLGPGSVRSGFTATNTIKRASSMTQSESASKQGRVGVNKKYVEWLVNSFKAMKFIWWNSTRLQDCPKIAWHLCPCRYRAVLRHLSRWGCVRFLARVYEAS